MGVPLLTSGRAFRYTPRHAGAWLWGAAAIPHAGYLVNSLLLFSKINFTHPLQRIP